MRALGPRLILVMCALFLVFLLARSPAGIARVAVKGVAWAVGSDVPSTATWEGWFQAMGIETGLPSTPDTTTTSPSAKGLPRIRWPMAGAVTTPFGKVKDAATGQIVDNTMITIQAPVGTPIYVAANGVVLAETATTAGEMVKVGDGPYTFVYKGVGNLRFHTGGAVTKGAILGTLYHQGPGDTARLGFEVEAGSVPINPAALLGPGASE